MKVIDLLNKTANGVTYTKKARIRYFDRKNDYEDECILNEVAIGYRLYNQNIELNDEVEVIEEKKIPEKINIKFWSDEEYTPEQRINVCMTYIDEIIDYLDYLKSKGDE